MSHPLEAWLRATHARFEQKYGLDLLAMASYALDDDGSLTIRTGGNTEAPFVYAEIASMPKGLISPFTAEVLRTYDPDLCGLPHWARTKIRAHNELKSYLREHGLLLISEWALLNDTSPTRVKESWDALGQGPWSAAELVALHSRYRVHYKEAMAEYRARTGKQSGWKPDTGFLQALAPEQAPGLTMEQLSGLEKAIRTLRSGQWQRGSSLDDPSVASAASERDLASPDDAAEFTPEELRGLIDAALQRALDAYMPAVIRCDGPKAQLLRCLWQGYTDGLGQRPLAERCGCSQSEVSKTLKIKQHTTAIATAAAVELKRHEAFAAVGQSVEGAERLVLALRNHLTDPEREGDIAPLRQWVQMHLDPS
ncbi:MAG: hypothetical protein VKI83_04905 [Synechococcaceae cyanobacterium]|nr:hypothetical protein [Synechococcaceae cyanobacterium]